MLADTGYWLALANPRDRWHRAAVAATQQLSAPLVVTWPVITETCHLLGRYGGTDAQIGFVEVLRASSEVHPQGIDHLVALRDLMAQYQDLPMDLADASLVAAAGELGHGRILSTDERDFGIYRWSGTEPFENLLLSFR